MCSLPKIVEGAAEASKVLQVRYVDESE